MEGNIQKDWQKRDFEKLEVSDFLKFFHSLAFSGDYGCRRLCSILIKTTMKFSQCNNKTKIKNFKFSKLIKYSKQKNEEVTNNAGIIFDLI